VFLYTKARKQPDPDRSLAQFRDIVLLFSSSSGSYLVEMRKRKWTRNFERKGRTKKEGKL